MLVPWRDADLFAERLRQVLEDRALHARMARQSRESVLGYGWERIADEHLALYADVRMGHPARAAASVS
jgi:glycosyltransferase involved in cell wall biosynthesis